MSEEEALTQRILAYKHQIIRRCQSAIDGLYLDFPVEDQDSETRGYERGLNTAREALEKLIIN